MREADEQAQQFRMGTLMRAARNGEQIGRYQYDPENRLVGLDANGDGDLEDAGDASFRYDSTGTRVGKTLKVADQDQDGQAESQETVYLVDPSNPTGYSQILQEASTLTLSGTVAQPTPVGSVSYTLGQDVIGQSRSDGQGTSTLSYLLYDGHGSTRLLAGSDGTIQERTDYEAFGQITSGSGDLTNLLYSGEQLDRDLHQYYLRARYYDPGIGRFSSFDSYEGDSSDPATLHKYIYANANPVYYLDPSGHEGLIGMVVGDGIRNLVMSLQMQVFSSVFDVVTGIEAGLEGDQIFANFLMNEARSLLPFDFGGPGVDYPESVAFDIIEGDGWEDTGGPDLDVDGEDGVEAMAAAGVSGMPRFRPPTIAPLHMRAPLINRLRLGPQGLKDIISHVRYGQLKVTPGQFTKSVQGTKFHYHAAEHARKVNRSWLHPEVPYRNGQPDIGGKGSVRLDGVLGPKERPEAVFDYKPRGSRGITPYRERQIRRHLPPNYQQIPIIVVYY